MRLRKESSASFDIGALEAEKGAIRQRGADHMGEIGNWHTHPDGGGEPSERDLDNWLAWRDSLGVPVYIGLIFSSRDGRWRSSNVHAWILRRDRYFERPVCEPAVVRWS